MNQSVSIIIPTLNAAKELPKLLNKIKSQSIRVKEVIVIDSESDDNTADIAKKNGTEVIKIKREEFDHGRTRNYAASISKGDILVFITQDALPEDNNTLEELIRPLTKNVIVSYARQIPKPGTIITDKFLRLYNYPNKSIIKEKRDIQSMEIGAFQNSNVCAAYQREEFLLLKGFPEPIISNEDMLFASKAIFTGYKVAYVAEARVLHSHNYKCFDLFKRYFDIGVSLDNEPLIKKLGKANSKGMDFIVNQLKFAIKEKELFSIARVFLEAIFKYAGYKLGVRNRYIPNAIKKHISLNGNYWLK